MDFSTVGRQSDHLRDLIGTCQPHSFQQIDSHRPVSLNDMRWCELEGKIQISRLSLKYYYTLSIFVMASNMEFKFFNVFLPIPSPKRTWDSPFYVKNNSFFFVFVNYQVFSRPCYSNLSCDPRKRKLLWSHWHTVKSAPITSESVIDTFGSGQKRKVLCERT